MKRFRDMLTCRKRMLRIVLAVWFGFVLISQIDSYFHDVWITFNLKATSIGFVREPDALILTYERGLPRYFPMNRLEFEYTDSAGPIAWDSFVVKSINAGWVWDTVVVYRQVVSLRTVGTPASNASSPVTLAAIGFRHWYLTITSALLLVWVWWQSRSRYQLNACHTCGYDLRGTLAAGRAQCPECGAAVVEAASSS
ncbi:MAG: hypothetical protein GVY24_04255 [Planctomycetes bacterium]|jgi:hypothetical protein|nr:hypothetical protein [Planctomycetota bacterium]